MFEILHRDGLARIGKLSVGGKVIHTPTILPVIHPFKPEPWISQIRELRLEGLITNSYILKKGNYPNGKDLHDFLNFDGMIMTDSGTFQEHMYGEIKEGNLEMVQFQDQVGSDIITIRDVFSEFGQGREEILAGLKETYRRGLEAREASKGYLAYPVQGGIYSDLRIESASLMQSLGGEYYPIGGIVPLMERYRYEDVVNIIINSRKGLKTSSVVHAFGAGHPMFFPILFLSGVDLVDSSSYIKYAREGRILTDTGTIELDEIAEELPPSPYFDSLTLDELRKMPEGERREIIGKHNLYVTVKEISKIREQIRKENLWNYVEYRVRAHPLLLGAYQALLKHYEYMEKFESRSKKSPVFFSGKETLERPLVKRFIDKERKRRSGVVIERKPYSYFAMNPADFVKTPFGTISLYLDETYPVAQSLFPGEYYEKDISFEKFRNPEWNDFLREKVNYIFNYQFGIKLFKIIDKNEIGFVISKNTGKIRNVTYRNEILISLRATDGLFSLNMTSAKLLHAALQYPKLRIAVDQEISSFIKEGRNVFCKFVKEADRELRPGDEVLIVDDADNLLSYGRTLLNREEMLEFKSGMAAKNRLKSTE